VDQFAFFDEPYQPDTKRENDNYHKNSRVLRSGSWNYYPLYARAAYRGRYRPVYLNFGLVGFRVARIGGRVG
jgi:formylglycine-generating enzyme required for sulfatase activity